MYPVPGGQPYYPVLPPQVTPHVIWPVLLWITAALAAIGTLGFTAGAIYQYDLADHMERNGVTVAATVTDHSWSDTVEVEFDTESGTTYTADVTTFDSYDLPPIGAEVDITYDPDDPYYVVAAGSDEDRIIAIVCTVLAALGLVTCIAAVVGAILVHRARTRSKNKIAGPARTLAGDRSSG